MLSRYVGFLIYCKSLRRMISERLSIICRFRDLNRMLLTIYAQCFVGEINFVLDKSGGGWRLSINRSARRLRTPQAPPLLICLDDVMPRPTNPRLAWFTPRLTHRRLFILICNTEEHPTTK